MLPSGLSVATPLFYLGYFWFRMDSLGYIFTIIQTRNMCTLPIHPKVSTLLHLLQDMQLPSPEAPSAYHLPLVVVGFGSLFFLFFKVLMTGPKALCTVHKYSITELYPQLLTHMLVPT